MNTVPRIVSALRRVFIHTALLAGIAFAGTAGLHAQTTVTSNKAAEFATVYDVQRYDGSAKTYKRALDAYDRLVDLIEQSIVETWRDRQAAAA